MTNKIYDAIKVLTPAFLGIAIAMWLAPAAARAAEAPIKEVLSGHIGWEVDKLTKGNVCTVESRHECSLGAASSEAGGFRFPSSIAVDNASGPEQSDVYVVDQGNQRVQVLTPSGSFVLMFGWDVNKTKETEGAPQAERNVCTAASGDVCKAGVEGAAVGQFAFPESVTIDPSTGNVFVEDFFNWRIQEFTAAGEFILMIGKGVNGTKDSTLGATAQERNLCTAISKDKCRVGEEAPEGSTEAGAFSFEQGPGELLAVGGPEGLFYVGDRHRVQIFNVDGMFVSEIPLASISSGPDSAVFAVAVDQTGNVFIAYSVNFVHDTIYEFNPNREEINRFLISPRQPEAVSVEVEVSAIAFDSAGRLAVTEEERGINNGLRFSASRGALYEVEAKNLHLITEFASEFPEEVERFRALSIAFGANDDMFVVGGNEFVSYVPVRVAGLAADPAICVSGTDDGTNTTLDCTLKGEVNPWGVAETEAGFQWGKTPILGLETGFLPLATLEEPIVQGAVLKGLTPNETYYYRLAAHDKNAKAPELLTSETASFKTPVVAPRTVGEPVASFVKPFSAVLFAELNPENTSTHYEFQYGSCESLENCAGLADTQVVESAIYGPIGATVEIKELTPNTQYRYRLFAENDHKEGTPVIEEGSFTTASAPAPQATTGPAGAAGPTSATIFGTVDPDGQPAVYTFEVGVYNGASTQYGTVLSESTGATIGPIAEKLALSGLQPGTTYAYKITVKSGYGTAEGEPAIFTTAGLSAVLAAPAPLGMLPVPRTTFPKTVVSKKPTTKCKRGFTRNKHSKCVKTKKKVKAKRKR
jgi:hypothetical protein